MTKSEIINKCNKKKGTIRTNHYWNVFSFFVTAILLLLCVVGTAIQGFFAGVVAMWVLSFMLIVVIFTGVPNSNQEALNAVDNEIAASIKGYFNFLLSQIDCLKPSSIETIALEKEDGLAITLVFKFKTENINEREKTMYIVREELSKVQQAAGKVIALDLNTVAFKE